MTKTVSDFIDTCRTRARQLKARQEEMGNTISLAQAYELMAAVDGHRTWAAMRAALEKAPLRPAADTTPPLTAADTHQDHCASFRMVRRYEPDAYEGGGDSVEAILRGARAELSYFFFDGEESPAMRFRGTERVSDEEYAVTVDVEMPEWVRGPAFNDYSERCMARATKGNVVDWEVAGYPEHAVDHDLVVDGSGRGRRNIHGCRRPK
ncbi:hypothetical protein HFO56_34015 [Rhizobium laguerreae]|uniref:glyoxalase superfamily protein n=1 Tax=Rhizobium laguerreae TaxID=1076926 RepID=UPI001C90A2D8|nr:glyoxalase superfamily protein [Rhizobium laguerreae]MBY3157343.1 hypothetical protein [Rhizobium laguerreae]